MKSSRGGCPLLLLSFVGLLFFAGQLPGTSGQNATEKAGTCPQTETVTTSGNCTEECQSDAHCEENQKCCPAGCGTSCQVPDELNSGHLKMPWCPDPDWACSMTGPGHFVPMPQGCQPPDKPGSCPKFASGISSLGFCMDKCVKDSDCDDNAKCCQNGCGKRSCLPPDL